MKKTLISILGPTAVGKTSFALRLAEQALDLVGKGSDDSIEKTEKRFDGVDLISADSRQVYKGLEVLSGADVPEGFEKMVVSQTNIDAIAEKTSADGTAHSYFKKDTINLHGVSIIEPTDEWSVAHFKNFAIKIIRESFANNRLPIIVGGTNLYINHLFNRDENLYVRPIKEVRAKAKSMSVEELQAWLKSLNPEKFSIMNNSDINNPRRLVRAIEISVGKPEVEEILNLPDEIENLKIGLTLNSDPEKNLKEISEKITKRVAKRFDNGAVEEVKKINKICKKDATATDLIVCSTLGVDDVSSYLNDEVNQEKCLENWALHEFQYAKRQLVWLKKEKNLIWLDDLNKSSYTLDNEKISI